MYLLGIDFGSRYIKAALCVKDIETGEITVLKLYKFQHKAAKQGTITDVVKAKEAFTELIDKMRTEFQDKIDNYIISISGENVNSYSGTSTIPLWKQENEDRRVKITHAHVSEVIKAAKMTAYNRDDKVELHSIPQEFQIDDQPATQNPVDMYGVKLRSSVYVIQTDKANMENLGSIPEEMSFGNYRIVYSPLATAEAVLDPDDKEAGAIVISIGDQTTELVVYLNGIVRMAKVIPFGSANITKDLKIMLKTDYATANIIKKEQATAFPKDADPEKMIEVPNSSAQKNEYTEEHIARVTEARLKEIYDFVTKEIYKGSYQRQVHTPVIITGPGSRLKGAEKLFSEINNSRTVKGKIVGVKSKIDVISDDYFTAVGLVKYAVNYDIFSDESADGGRRSVAQKLKKFFADLL
ncbi:MAG TPA: cell division protein FtsA [Clostridiales bacterium]|jgi:cell division protein FtsA|nr:cell division protein FtsA [Clostridiales bacterium]HQP69470.1 cell division protein FtsA [Clostridiales bacterium]